MLQALAAIPMGVWKRLALYPLLGIVLGQGCGCQRPSLLTDVLLALLAAVGLVGVVASLGRLSEAGNGFAVRLGLVGGAGRRGGAAAGPVGRPTDAGLSATIATGDHHGAGLAGCSRWRCSTVEAPRDRSVSSNAASEDTRGGVSS
jgi:hypothetical protein